MLWQCVVCRAKVGVGSCTPWAGGWVPVADPQLVTGVAGDGAQGLQPPFWCFPPGPAAPALEFLLPHGQRLQLLQGRAQLWPGGVCAAWLGAVLCWGSASAVVQRCSKALINAKRGKKKKAPGALLADKYFFVRRQN